MEQQIVKVPENEVSVALGGSQVAVFGGIDPEEDLAIRQQGEKLDPGKAVLPAQSPDALRRGQHGERGRDLRIANPEQRSGARRFQHHRVAAPPHVGETRQDENLGIAERRRLRPIVGNLRLDDDCVRVARSPDRVLQQAMPGQSPDQPIHLLRDGRAVGSERSERQTRVQLLRTIRRAGAERAQVERVAIGVSDEVSVGPRFERGVRAQPGGNGSRPDPSPSRCCWCRQGGPHV